MAQSTTISPQIPVKPITLSIIPKSTSHNITPNIPTFNHVPITPTIIPQQQVQILDAGDKLAHKAEKNREHQRRHTAKVKPFQQLATIENSEERMVALINLSYPELSQLPKYILHQEVDLFIQALKSKYICN
jgi:hypothetical protein